MMRLRTLFLATLMVMVTNGATAQGRLQGISLTGQPRNWDVQAAPARIDGFGRARFGMTLAEVKAVIASEYPGAAGTLKEATDPVDRTHGMAIELPRLAPAPGVATISYVFGASSGKLVAVNVSWLLDGNPAAAERDALLAAGTATAAGYVGYQWPELATGRGHVIDRNALILFAGRDEKGAGVEVRLDGVAFDVERPAVAGRPQAPEHRAAPTGPARLRLALAAQPLRPDVYRIPAGQF